jgi:ABC-type polysaccharide/polyol phosphate transport system ATPase subunit
VKKLMFSLIISMGKDFLVMLEKNSVTEEIFDLKMVKRIPKAANEESNSISSVGECVLTLQQY